MLTRRVQAKYTTVAINYFIKLVEAEPLTTIAEAKTRNFICKNIIYKFGIPFVIMTYLA